MNKIKVKVNYMTIIFIILTLIIVVVSVHHDTILKKGRWFQRSGGIISSLGTFLLIWNIAKNGIIKSATDQHIIDGGHFEDDISKTITEETKNIIAVWVSTILIILGTLASSFGDLIN